MHGGTDIAQRETLDGASHGLRNAVVSLEREISSAELVPTARVIVNQHCAFSPGIMAARVGQALEIRNRDPVMRNTHVSYEGKTFLNVAQVPGGRPIQRSMKRAGVHDVVCDAHKFMKGYILTFEHPYFALTDQEGTFRLVGVPPGPAGVDCLARDDGAAPQDVCGTAGRRPAVNVEYP